MDKICTVILASYNHAPYIVKCIEGILSQKTKYPFIIKIFDDASTDGSQDIIKEYAQKHPDLIEAHISETNLGAQANIWRAHKSVDTKYYIYTETDDYWCDDTKLETQINILEKHPECSFCAHNTRQINVADKIRSYITYNSVAVKNGKMNQENCIVKLQQLDFEPFNYIPHPSSRLIRTSSIEIDKIKHKEAFLFDNCQFYFLLAKGDMYYIPKVMSTYVATGTGTSSGSTNPYRRLRIHIEALFELEDEFKGTKAQPKIERNVYKEIFYCTRTSRILAKHVTEIFEKAQKRSKLKKLWAMIRTCYG